MVENKPELELADGELIRKNDCAFIKRKLLNGWVQTMDKHELEITHYGEGFIPRQVTYFDLDQKAVRKSLRNKSKFMDPWDSRVEVRHQNLHVYEKEVDCPQNTDFSVKKLIVGVADSTYVYYIGLMGAKGNSPCDHLFISFTEKGLVEDFNSQSWEKWGKKAFSSKEIQKLYKGLYISLGPLAVLSLRGALKNAQTIGWPPSQ